MPKAATATTRATKLCTQTSQKDWSLNHVILLKQLECSNANIRKKKVAS